MKKKEDLRLLLSEFGIVYYELSPSHSIEPFDKCLEDQSKLLDEFIEKIQKLDI